MRLFEIKFNKFRKRNKKMTIGSGMLYEKLKNMDTSNLDEFMEKEKITTDEFNDLIGELVDNKVVEVKLINNGKGGKVYYSITEVAKKLSVHRNTIIRWINDKKLKAIKIEKQWIIKKEDLEDFIKKGEK